MRAKSLAEFGLPIELAEAHAPVVLFDKVDLAFDEKVILTDVTFSVRAGHTKIFLGASGAGKSTILKLMLGLLKPDSGTIWVLGHRVDLMNEAQLMRVRHHMGMVFQEGALFDSLTVGENVGYKLYEETQVDLDEVRQRVVLDMAFNMGYRALSFKNTIRCVILAEYDKAADNMMLSKWADDVGDGPGKQFDRAERLSLMMRTGEDYLK